MEPPKRKTTRLKNYDYSTPGWYFITICVQGRRCVLSEINVGEGLAPPGISLTNTGVTVETQLLQIPSRFPQATVEKYVIMPNHIHFILGLQNDAGGASPSPTIPQIVGAFKSLVSHQCAGETKLFQRSFYDHIIRGETDFLEICAYIDQNPAKWQEDCFYVRTT